ncbi:hypothetical protein V5O48_011723 [Marasmius crinis-equi]|uniref:Uncharacterized protein n=1 Tax=Marasmius crinis-equi TaxID=585013 RepID=A0ABR3F5B1_9AGAR
MRSTPKTTNSAATGSRPPLRAPLRTSLGGAGTTAAAKKSISDLTTPLTNIAFGGRPRSSPPLAAVTVAPSTGGTGITTTAVPSVAASGSKRPSPAHQVETELNTVGVDLAFLPAHLGQALHAL